jgi:hypothetical protein
MSYFQNFVDNISSTGRGFFLNIFRRNSAFHKLLTAEMLTVFRVPHDPSSFELTEEDMTYLVPSQTVNSMTLSSALENGYLLFDPNHFLPSTIEVLFNWSNFQISESLTTQLLMVAFYFHDVQNLKRRLDEQISWMKKDESRIEMVQQFLKWLLYLYVLPELNQQEKFSFQRVKWPKCELFAPLSFEDFMSCANQASIAAQLLRSGNGEMSEGKGSHTLSKLFWHYLKTFPPRLWLKSFEQCKTIAYFIKYVDREDLVLAYDKFKEVNSTNPNFLKYLKKVQLKFHEPVVSSETLFSLTTSGSQNTAENFNRFFNELISQGNDQGDMDMRLIFHLTAKWMQLSKTKVMVPLPPRNAQLITLLVCASWAKRLLIHNDTSAGKGVIAQVGTGEGKSLIIAMMAIYFVKVLKKRVHILENNLGLLEKDFKEMQPIFKEFGIFPRGGNPSSPEQPDLTRTTLEALHTKDCRNEFPDFGVTYCLRRNMERYYQDCMMKGIHYPFKDTVLIVDEVDDLIVDANPNQFYAAPDNEEAEFVRAINHFKTGAHDMPDDNFIWDLAFNAFHNSNSLQEGVHYVRSNNTLYMIDDGGNQIDAYDYRLECLKQHPKLKTNYYAQSIPYMLSQYECITGFSGSIGAQEYLQTQFQTWSFYTPSFLNTCRDVIKVPAALMDDPARRGFPCAHVMPTREEQLKKVVQIAARKYMKVPVLIIAASTREAYELEEIVRDYIKTHHDGEDEEKDILAGDDPNEFLQLFLQYKKDTIIPDKENWHRIVSKATAKCSDRYRITVTDPFGGRGHDFDVHDEAVESNGGLAVIMTSIPSSEREWIQWKGRTARRDNKGQYTVVLAATDETLVESPEVLIGAQDIEDQNSTRYTSQLIDKIVALRNIKEAERLRQSDQNISLGRRLNKLCDEFYRDLGPMNEFTWTSSEEEVELRNLLTNELRNHQLVDEAFRKLQLPDAPPVLQVHASVSRPGYDSDEDIRVITMAEELINSAGNSSEVPDGSDANDGSLIDVSYGYEATNGSHLQSTAEHRIRAYLARTYNVSLDDVNNMQAQTKSQKKDKSLRQNRRPSMGHSSSHSHSHSYQQPDLITNSEEFDNSLNNSPIQYDDGADVEVVGEIQDIYPDDEIIAEAPPLGTRRLSINGSFLSGLIFSGDFVLLYSLISFPSFTDSKDNTDSPPPAAQPSQQTRRLSQSSTSLHSGKSNYFRLS